MALYKRGMINQNGRRKCSEQAQVKLRSIRTRNFTFRMTSGQPWECLGVVQEFESSGNSWFFAFNLPKVMVPEDANVGEKVRVWKMCLRFWRGYQALRNTAEPWWDHCASDGVTGRFFNTDVRQDVGTGGILREASQRQISFSVGLNNRKRTLPCDSLFINNWAEVLSK